MDDIQVVVSIITNLGIPAACLFFLFKYLSSRESVHDGTNKNWIDLNQKWIEAITENSRVMTELCNKMDFVIDYLIRVGERSVNDDKS